MIDAGVDAYVFISNQFAKEDESGEDVAKKKTFEYLLDHIDGDMFGVYECPAPSQETSFTRASEMVCRD